MSLEFECCSVNMLHAFSRALADSRLYHIILFSAPLTQINEMNRRDGTRVNSEDHRDTNVPTPRCTN